MAKAKAPTMTSPGPAIAAPSPLSSDSPNDRPLFAPSSSPSFLSNIFKVLFTIAAPVLTNGVNNGVAIAAPFCCKLALVISIVALRL